MASSAVVTGSGGFLRGLRAQVSAFLLGAVTMAGVGYFYLRRDIFRAHSIVNESVESLGENVKVRSEQLERRIAAMEDELAAMRARQGDAPSD